MIIYSFTKHAERDLAKLSLEIQRRVVKKIKYYIETENPLHYADSIKGESGKVYRFQIGDWRVIFDWLGSEIRVTKIRPRPNAYPRHRR